MDVAVSVLICFFSALLEVYSGVPPDVCFQQFKWEDCGMPPKAVIYYYKSGSRCEVGFWRGCQPNPNMFADEYECVQTCIFSVRARPQDYHQFQDNIIEIDDTTAVNFEDTTAGTEAVNTTDTGNSTGVEEVEGATTDVAGVDHTGDGTTSTVSSTIVQEDEAAATEAPPEEKRK